MNGGNDSLGDRQRVYSRIAPIVMAFAEANAGRLFHADDLRRYVIGKVPEIAPDSPGRILRELRLGGRLSYIVVNRRLSLYQFRKVAS